MGIYPADHLPAMSMMSIEELEEYVSSGKYWVVEFISDDWIHTLVSLYQEFYEDAPKEACIILEGKNENLLFLFRKDELSKEVINERLGVPYAVMATTKMIRLLDLAPEDNPPDPTVDVYGTA